MSWWLWALGGLALVGLEIMTPGGFFFIFFGVGALGVAALAATGLVAGEALQWLLFSVVSVLSLVLLRGTLARRLRPAEGGGVGTETLVGELAVLVDDVAAGGIGKAELRGTAWSVRTTGGASLARGQRCRVERVDGLTLWLRPE